MSNYVGGNVMGCVEIDLEENKIFREGKPGNNKFCFSHIEFETSFRHLSRTVDLVFGYVSLLMF